MVKGGENLNTSHLNINEVNNVVEDSKLVTKKKMSNMRKKELIAAAVLVGPAVLYLVIWILAPAFYALFLSFTNYDLLRPAKMAFIGIQNYIELLKDTGFLMALKNTAVYAIGVVPIQAAIALFLAVVCNQKIKAKAAFRVIYYLPGITSGVAIASIFLFLFSKEGVVNSILGTFGFEAISWAASPKFALPLIIIMAIWAGTGFQMLIFLAGLQDIPESLYEASDIDGASKLQQFWYVTVPMLKAKTFFVLATGFIGALQVFDMAYIVSGGTGGPDGSTMTAVLYLYTEAFKKDQMGYACAAAFILFGIILLLTLIQKKFFDDKEAA